MRQGRGFRYLDADGAPLPAAQRERIRRLAIPPAWNGVWICPWPHGHIQAVGTDAAGRRQYLYHGRCYATGSPARGCSCTGRAAPGTRCGPGT
ncbi:hypothetical protein [Streptomyces globosus]|uniref:hypothetical protein n=1 Tax=Streptomyces globosus TaxID=68209 RepID=UPI0026D4B55E